MAMRVEQKIKNILGIGSRNQLLQKATQCKENDHDKIVRYINLKYKT